MNRFLLLACISASVQTTLPQTPAYIFHIVSSKNSVYDPKSFIYRIATLRSFLSFFADLATFPSPQGIPLLTSIMKSVSFLRNTWKKWESKASDSRGNAENVISQGRKKASYAQSSTATGRPLTITVKHLPLDVSIVNTADGMWASAEDQDPQPPPSPIYDQYRGEHSLVHRDSSRYALNITYHTQGDTSPKSPKLNSQAFPTSSKATYIQASPRSSQTPMPVHNDREGRAAGSRYLSLPRQTPPPQSPTLPTYQLLPPIDLNYGPGSKFEKSLEAGCCNCVDFNPQAKHHSRCPRYAFSEAPKSMSSRVVSDNTHPSQKTVHAVLDLSVDSKPRSLYHRTGSTPHLPYKDVRGSRSPPSEHSVYSADGSEADHFPLSLFPAPPPLIVRKKIPTPLLLRPLKQPSSSHSSRDSTPVGTPTTPRFHATPSPSQSSIASPSKKHFSLRPSASFSPPPFSPPNSPLPSLPTTPDGSRRPSESRWSPKRDAAQPLRNAQSNASLRDALPFPAMHRLTSSEPISDQSSLPIRIRRPAAKPRPEAVRGVKDLQAYMELKDPYMPSSNVSDAHVQWGYAL